MLKDILIHKLKILHDTIWEGRASQSDISQWLGNFHEAREQLHALHLLANFLYFGHTQIRELAHALYRDEFRYPIVEQIRRRNADTLDRNLIANEFRAELERTRFFGVGNPSESGTHLLYYFRQENRLPKTLFASPHEIFRFADGTPELANDQVSRYVFIDDLTASGQQVVEYCHNLLIQLKRLMPSSRTSFLALFATPNAVTAIQHAAIFDEVRCVFELDETFDCFGRESRYFRTPHMDIDQTFAESTARKYGLLLWPTYPLGYDDCGLMLGFHHNTPDNTLPIFWFNEPEGHPWQPIFPRYPKVDR